MQHRAPRNTPGRHRRTEPLHSHRAPREPITEKGRYAVAAALVAGVGVTGVTTAGGGTSAAGAVGTSRTHAASQPFPASPSPAGASSNTTTSDATTTTSSDATAIPAAAAAPVQVKGDAAAADLANTASPFAAQRLKAKPMPLWVNPMPEGAVTSCMGPRWGRLHAGVDLAAASGTPIRAAGKGVVVAAGPAEGYGNAVLIDHGNGYLTHYGHMSVITAKLGQHVEAGDQIGEEGSTGHSTGPHLHFEVHKGSYHNPIEPTQWMHEHGVDIQGCVTFKD
ncbi:M23 family metallopeptidase [Actinoplanes sp. NPDC049548]|uniref:M23 family metallopeptidase n=1 Tax=Actinoplanes sp. NPDC049548 TaxID=3155152 RepID=UPI00342CFA50